MSQTGGRTKSKWVAFFLAAFFVSDLYLGYPKVFRQKVLLCFTVVGIVYVVFTSWADMFRIATGRIDCDANGVPLV